jgi:hypothetical protein
MKPFKLMDQILEDKETWDFKDDPDISVYTYLSVLGSGSLVPTIVFFLQMIIPIFLFLQALKSERDLEVFGYFGDEKVRLWCNLIWKSETNLKLTFMACIYFL